MIAFFPDPYPDELAYSLFARYHVHSGSISFSSTARELFQTKDAIPNPEFFAPLSEEVRSIITRSSTMEDFITKHTMLPYYIRFLPLERRRNSNGRGKLLYPITKQRTIVALIVFDTVPGYVIMLHLLCFAVEISELVKRRVCCHKLPLLVAILFFEH